ncbi:NUDIX domain-containing protein [Bacillus mangrovi]|uniref:NUDIX domain-containing protein n=1 Tax=Metabacillus mangrovi TaxID=1491830 RepID=A0A7X2S7K3_9BACI|nr:NUDIX domain-containing protein [Metabacillus mangrovi]MTH54656.1 NUDIX domain-containing protein [Metabacillus mangrovi]
MNKEAVEQYDSSVYRTPDGYTSDIAVFTIHSEKREHKPPVVNLMLMLIRRAEQTAEGTPNIEAGKWALPGGFVQPDETALEAAHRELEEETGVKGIHMKHYGMYDRPGRDPRGWILSNAHYAIVPEDLLVSRKASDDAEDVQLFRLEELKTIPLAFDHAELIADAIREIRSDLLQTTAAKNFLPSEFTYSELQAVLLTVTDDPAIKSEQAFARKIKTLPFIAEAEGKTTARTSKKPAKLYKFKEMDVIKPIYTARY